MVSAVLLVPAAGAALRARAALPVPATAMTVPPAGLAAAAAGATAPGQAPAENARGRPQRAGPPARQQALEALRAGRVRAAIPLLRAWAAERPQDPEARFYLGRALLQVGDAAGAREALREAEALGAGAHPGVNYYLGVAAQQLGDMAAAERRFRRTLEVDPGSVSARRSLAFLYLLTGRPEQAQPLLEQLVAERPDDALAWHYLGAVRWAAGRFAAARDAFARAIRAEPGMTDARLGEAKALATLGRLDEADRHLEELTRQAPELAEAWFEWGRLALREGEVEQAIARLERALLLEPTHERARYNLGLAYRRAGREADARALLEAAAKQQVAERQRQRELLREVVRDQAGELYRQALEALAAGHPQAAAARFEEAIAAAGEAATAAFWLGLGSARLQAGDAEAAALALRRAVDLDPEMAVAWRLLADALERLGEADAAAAARARYQSLVGR